MSVSLDPPRAAPECRVPVSALILIVLDLYIIDSWVSLVAILWPGASIRPMDTVAYVSMIALAALPIGIVCAVLHFCRYKDRTNRWIALMVFILGLSPIPVFVLVGNLTEILIGYRLSP